MMNVVNQHFKKPEPRVGASGLKALLNAASRDVKQEHKDGPGNSRGA